MTPRHTGGAHEAESCGVAPVQRWLDLLLDPARPRDTIDRLACELGVDRSTIHRWREGRMEPSRQSLMHLRLLVLARKAAPVACEGMWAATDDEWVERVESITHRACVPAEAARYRTLTRSGVSAEGVSRG